MASQRLITLHYADTRTHSFPVSISSAYPQLQQALASLLPDSNCLVLIEASRKLIVSAKDLEAAFRDTAGNELTLRVYEKRASERLSEALVRTGASASPLKAEGLEIGNRTDIGLVEAGLQTYVTDPAFTRLILQRDSLSPSDFSTVQRLIREGKSLKDVYVQQCDMSEEVWSGVLQTIGEKPELKRLKLEGVSLAGERFQRLQEALRRLDALEALEIAQVAVTSADLRTMGEIIGRMKRLKKLVFRNTPLHHFQPLLPHLRLLTSLHILEVSHCNLESADLPPLLPVLIDLPLTRLDLSHNSLDSDACSALSLLLFRSETVVEVALEGNQIGAEGVKLLQTTVAGLRRTVRVEFVGKLRLKGPSRGDSDSYLLSSFHDSSCSAYCSDCLLL